MDATETTPIDAPGLGRKIGLAWAALAWEGLWPRLMPPLAFIVLGCIFNFNGMLWCNGLAVFTAFASARLKVKPLVALWLNRVTGGLFLALGLRLALAEQH